MKKGIPFALRTETPADIADFVNNNFREIFEERAGGYTLEELDDRYLNDNSMVQIVHSQTGAVATGTTAIPYDDTIPQQTEGDEYLTVSITPHNSDNILIINVLLVGSLNDTHHVLVALFKDATANAIAATLSYSTVLNTTYIWRLRHKMVAGTTNQITFKVRAGTSTDGTFTFNGAIGSRLLGGVIPSQISIVEYST